MNKKNIARIAVVVLFAGWVGTLVLAPKSNRVLANAFPKELLASKETCTTPDWPTEARRYEVEGITVVHFKIDERGAVDGATVAKSSSWQLLDDAALVSLVKCKFKPGLSEVERDKTFPVQFVWTLAGTPAVRPVLVPGSCAASARFVRFEPYVHEPSSADGVLVRFLVNGQGLAFGVKAEGGDAAANAAAVDFIQRCRFAPDASRTGERTDTLYGRVVAAPVKAG